VSDAVTPEPTDWTFRAAPLVARAGLPGRILPPRWLVEADRGTLVLEPGQVTFHGPRERLECRAVESITLVSRWPGPWRLLFLGGFLLALAALVGLVWTAGTPWVVVRYRDPAGQPAAAAFRSLVRRQKKLPRTVDLVTLMQREVLA
jgi:hypothetical protein